MDINTAAYDVTLPAGVREQEVRKQTVSEDVRVSHLGGSHLQALLSTIDQAA